MQSWKSKTILQYICDYTAQNRTFSNIFLEYFDIFPKQINIYKI